MRVVGVLAVRGVRVLGVRAMIWGDGALFQARRRAFAREARPRARERDQPGQNGAEQR